jgi:hypothetical protein
MAKDYLGVPGSTVDMEREFSKGSDMVVRKRGRLAADTIRACMCLKSWIDKGLYDIVKYWDGKDVRI